MLKLMHIRKYYKEHNQHVKQFMDPRSGLVLIMPSRMSKTCADPESFVRGGPKLITSFFLLMRRERIQIPQYAGQHRPASETPFKWRFAGRPMPGPMMAQH